jgi:serine/threonine protein kinase
MALPAGARLGPYKVLSALGSGGMGEIYKAQDTRLDRLVALKVLPSEYAADPIRRAGLEREARAVAALSHPNICALFDIGHDGGIDYLVMEYLEGETLSARLSRKEMRRPDSTQRSSSSRVGGVGLPLQDALRFATDIADALAAAHRAGVVHRDLKPGNVMLTRGTAERWGSHQAKVLDFGLAKRSAGIEVRADDETRSSDQLISDHRLIGTLPYMAPEQLEGRAADARSDLFSFGALVYEMVSGRRPFAATSAATLIAEILLDEPEPLTAVQPLTPRGLDRLVRKCLAKNPDARWQSAFDVADELRWLASDFTASGSARRVNRFDSEDRPNLGRLVAGLCDRQAQEDEFRDQFLDAIERCPGVPQVFFITGEEGQCHETLVQRLVDRVDRSIGPEAVGRSGGRVKKVPWQHDGVLTQRYSRLLYSLFEYLGSPDGRQLPYAKDRSATAFDALLTGSLNAYVAIQHEVHATRWDRTTTDLLTAYMKFLADIPPSQERPVVVVFVSVILPRSGRSAWTKLLPALDSAASRRKTVQRALRALEEAARIPCCVLAELPPVTREDLLEWFSLNHIYESEDRRIRAIERLFPSGVTEPKAMWEVEAFCAEELRAFALERGYAEMR